AKRLFPDGLDQLNRIDGTYDNLKPDETMKYLFRTALSFASIVAGKSTLTELFQAFSGDTAKLSFLIIIRTWELLEQQTQLDDDIRGILRGLSHVQDVVEVLGQASSSTLATTLDGSRGPITGILALLEEASVYIFNQLAVNNPGDTYNVDWYSGELECLKNAFHASWSPPKESPVHALCGDSPNEDDENPPVSAWEDFQATMDEPAAKLTDPYDILNLLNPLDPSGYDPSQACLDGTRKAVLKRIITWTQNRKNPESFMWISGQAGMGKTSIATSLCRYLDNNRALAGSFFCKREDPNFGDPHRLLNNLVYEITTQCPPYAHEVTKAIRANRRLCTAHFDIRYEGLVKDPLQRLKSLSAPAPLIVVVDALDECRDCDSRRQVMRILLNMSQLVPWLKVIVTARPERDLMEEFRGQGSREPIVHLQTYDASDDIRAYINGQLGHLAQKEQWPDDGITQLCMMAQGVFLWAALATKFIKNSTIPALSRLQQVLANQKSPITDYFDALYTQALRGAMNDHNDDTKEAYTRCIGAIFATLEHKPLAIPNLDYLLAAAGRIGQGTIERIVASLSPLVIVADGRYVKFHHSSFKDYANDPLRSHAFHIQFKKYEADLANCCLTVMQQDLRFNISSPNQALVDTIVKFLEGPQLMYWIEVLSLIGRLDLAFGGLSKLMSLKLTQFGGWGLIVFRAKDAQQFLLSFYDAIAASAPHLYVSALAFSPTSSQTARRMRPYFPNTVTITKGADLTWHPCIKTITHPHAIQSLSISPDGLKIIAGYPDGSLCIWDKQTGTRISESLVGHTDSVTCVTFSPRGDLAASGSNDTTIRVWEVVEGLKITTHALTGHSGPVNSVAFSPNAAVIASGSTDKTIRLWDPKALRSISGLYVGHSSRVSSLAFSPDGTKLVSGSWDKTIRIWAVDLGNRKLADNPLLIMAHSDTVTCVAFSPDGSKIASGSVDKTMQLWDPKTGDKIESATSSPRHSDTVTSIAFSPNGNLIASSSSDGAVQLWHAATFAAYSHPFGHFSPVNAAVFSPDGLHVVSGSTDMTIRVWEISACPKVMVLAPFTGHASSITSIVVSSDGTRIISGSSDKTLRIWDAQTGAPIGDPFTGHTQQVNCVAITSDGARIASASSDMAMNLLDTTSHTIIHSYQHTYNIRCIAFSPDGALIAYADDNYRIYLRDSLSWDAIGEALQGHSSLVYSMAFSPDGACIASASSDGTVILWDTDNHNRLGPPLSGHTSGARSIAFSPCSTLLVSGSGDGTVQIWDKNTGILARKLTGYSGYPAIAVAFSLDGSCVASGSSDGTIRLWNPTNGQAIGQPILAPSRSAQAITFSPEGNYALVGSSNTIRVQSLDESLNTNARDPPGTHRWPSNPHMLSAHPHHPGWVTHDQKSHVFWLPAQYQQPAQLWDTHKQVPHPQTSLDYSKFVHGTAWTSIARQP
ncbi:hypothetical protein FRC11_003232, partial [Ceratobasidium sp. 423]